MSETNDITKFRLSEHNSKNCLSLKRKVTLNKIEKQPLRIFRHHSSGCNSSTEEKCLISPSKRLSPKTEINYAYQKLLLTEIMCCITYSPSNIFYHKNIFIFSYIQQMKISVRIWLVVERLFQRKRSGKDLKASSTVLK